MSTTPTWRRALERYDFLGGYKRVWLAGNLDRAIPADNVVAVAYQFSSHEDAAGFHRWVIGFSCSVAPEAFSVPDFPGGVGLRFNFEDGRVLEQVSWVSNERRFIVGLGDALGRPDRTELLQILNVAATHIEKTETLCVEAFHHMGLGNGPMTEDPALQRKGPLRNDVLPRVLPRVPEARFEEDEFGERVEPLFGGAPYASIRYLNRSWITDTSVIEMEVRHFKGRVPAHSGLGAEIDGRCRVSSDVSTEPALRGSVVLEDSTGPDQDMLLYRRANRVYMLWVGGEDHRALMTAVVNLLARRHG